MVNLFSQACLGSVDAAHVAPLFLFHSRSDALIVNIINFLFVCF
jgi:hypothetical protein